MALPRLLSQLLGWPRSRAEARMDVMHNMLNGAGSGRVEPVERDDEADLVGQYLCQITATPLLAAEQEVELAKRIEAGVYAAELLRRADAGEAELSEVRRRELAAVAADGQRAKDHMIRANLRLVVSAAKRYPRRGLSLLDVIQEGNLGLMHAVEKFDYTKGFKFSTYAMWWIRQSIDRGLAQHARTIRLPTHLIEDLSHLARHEQQLRHAAAGEPTIEEVAEAAGMPVEKVAHLRNLAHTVVSLDTPVGERGTATVGDLIKDTDVLAAPDVVEYQELAQQLRGVIDTLPPREALILTLRYGLHTGTPCTLQQVAERIGLTRERVRQLEKQALAELRHPQRREALLAWAS